MKRRARPLARMRRYLLIAAGSLALALGVVGAFLPLLPTTPFVLLAAACYAKSSRRLFVWLNLNPVFGKILRRYRAGRGIPRGTKIVAQLTVAASIGLSAALAVPDRLWLVRWLLIGIGIAVIFYIGRIKPLPPKQPAS